MKTLSLLLLSSALVALPAHAVTVASWDFTAASGQLNDTSGNGHNLTNGGNVTFSTSTGADFDGTNAGDLQGAYNASIEPGSIGAGQVWSIEVTGVVLDATNSFRTVYSSRSANGYGTVIYRYNSAWQFWTGKGVTPDTDKWNVVSVAAPSGEQTLTASWDGTTMSLTADNGTTSVSNSGTPTTVGFNDGSKNFAFGNGGNSISEFFLDGRIKTATIAVVPEPSTTGLLAFAGLALAFKRRRL
ncbi:MAG: PEP-CTERM sorting domain-containing protein [Akkermansiaceae bacterium]|nr:PEP-CTERM sorting domain-containing protein [Akkermansiaceae bacterium]